MNDYWSLTWLTRLVDMYDSRRGMTSMDMMMDPDAMDMPLTPASFAGLDHKDLEERPLTSLTNRMGKATVYDDPPEK